MTNVKFKITLIMLTVGLSDTNWYDLQKFSTLYFHFVILIPFLSTETWSKCYQLISSCLLFPVSSFFLLSVFSWASRKLPRSRMYLEKVRVNPILTFTSTMDLQYKTSHFKTLSFIKLCSIKQKVIYQTTHNSSDRQIDRYSKVLYQRFHCTWSWH